MEGDLIVEAYSSEGRHVLGAMGDFLLRAMEKVKVTKGSNIAMVYVDMLAT